MHLPLYSRGYFSSLIVADARISSKEPFLWKCDLSIGIDHNKLHTIQLILFAIQTIRYTKQPFPSNVQFLIFAICYQFLPILY